MFRPRSGNDIRVLDASMDVNVAVAGRLGAGHAVELGHAGHAGSSTPTNCRSECRVRIEHDGVRGIDELPLAPHARRWPFDYTADERRDLGALLERHYPDPDGRLFEWCRPFLAPSVRPDTRELLTSIATAIKAGFRYEIARRAKAHRRRTKRYSVAREPAATLHC